MAIDEMLKIAPFSLKAEAKAEIFKAEMDRLNALHYEACLPFRRIVDALDIDLRSITKLEEMPFLPVSVFKELRLLSVPEEEVVKTITSSGTSGQAVSRIFLDKTTAANQQKVLVKIVNDFIGGRRLPMLIIDSPSVIKDRAAFSARGAGIIGFSIFSSDRAYALNEAMELDFEAIETFLAKHQGRDILVFGFTFMIWQHFQKALAASGRYVDLSRARLIHGGGWKKLISESVSPQQFAEALHQVCGISHIHDYYGMAEQTGGIYMQCEAGHLHASIFSAIMMRDPVDFSIVPDGSPGIIQVMSVIARSYPGHSLLTEDEGLILGRDDCPCGRLGAYFKVLGRIKNAEIRGCSDTYAAEY